MSAPKGGVDRPLLHRYLWSKSDRMNRLQLNQQALAAELGVNQYTVSRIMREFLESGRVRRLAIGRGNSRTYVVMDPDSFPEPEDEPAEEPPPRFCNKCSHKLETADV